MSASCSKAPENVVPAPLHTLSVHKMAELCSPICQIWYMLRIRPELDIHIYFQRHPGMCMQCLVALESHANFTTESIKKRTKGALFRAGFTNLSDLVHATYTTRVAVSHIFPAPSWDVCAMLGGAGISCKFYNRINQEKNQGGTFQSRLHQSVKKGTCHV